jgi:hypothetical protein
VGHGNQILSHPEKLIYRALAGPSLAGDQLAPPSAEAKTPTSVPT